MGTEADQTKECVSGSRLRVEQIIALCVLLLIPVPACRKHREPAERSDVKDSADLKRTSVVATLDCPIPEHNNVIWCSTFQLAWDKLRNDVIGEPVRVTGEEELVGRLNRAEVSHGDIEEGSFYAAAGSVHDGIIEQIREEMSRRFTSGPTPVFDKRHTTIGDAIVAYGHLNVEVRPKHPFYENNNPLIFVDSGGRRTDVAWFCEFESSHVEILYHKYDDNQNTAEFAVDLCDDTSPYRIIAADVPRCATLRQSVAAVEKKISEFRHDPNYTVLRKLWTMESLGVPNVLYELMHHFAELEGKKVKNRQLANYFMGQAVQTIDFALMRTRLTTTFEYILPPPPRRYIPKARCLRFDRPFLIYVKKRADGARPFFVMWVDNAELMARPDQDARRKHEATCRLYNAITAPDVNEAEVQSAISSGADLNAPWDIELGTALHIAVNRADRSLVGLLIANGADVKAKDYRGRTALDYAVFLGGRADIVELLKGAGGDAGLEAKPERGPEQ